MSHYLNQPEPTILSVPNIKPYMEFIGTLQSSGFWLVKVEPRQPNKAY